MTSDPEAEKVPPDAHAAPGPDASRPTSTSALSPSPLWLRPWLDNLDRIRWIIPLLIGLLYAAGWAPHFRITPDAAAHLSIAQRIVDGTGYLHPSGVHAHVQPGVPSAIAGFLRLADDPQPFPLLNVAFILCGLLAAALFYALARLWLDRPAALIVLLLFALSRNLVAHTLVYLADVPFLAAALVFLLAYEALRRNRHLAPRLAAAATMAGAIALMVTLRTVSLTFAAAFVAAMVVHLLRGPGRLLHAGMLLTIAAVVVGLRLGGGGFERPALNYDERTALHVLRQDPGAVFEAAAQNLPEILFQDLQIAMLGVDFGPIVGLPCAIAFAAMTIVLARTRPLWTLIMLAFVLQFTLFLSEVRYYLILAPFMALGWWRLAIGVAGAAPDEWRRPVWLVLILLPLIPNLVRDLDVAVEQHREPFLAHYRDGRYDGLDDVARWAATQAPPNLIVLTEDPTLHAPLTFMGYAHRPAHICATASTVRKLPMIDAPSRPLFWLTTEPRRPSETVAEGRFQIAGPPHRFPRRPVGPPYLVYPLERP